MGLLHVMDYVLVLTILRIYVAAHISLDNNNTLLIDSIAKTCNVAIQFTHKKTIPAVPLNRLKMVAVHIEPRTAGYKKGDLHRNEDRFNMVAVHIEARTDGL